MNTNWRLILDGACNGYYNMSLDEAILHSYSEFTRPTLRIYGWQHPIISIGYNQDIAQVLKPNTAIPFVRRLTGGAAILHEKELTYSITCSLEDLDLPRPVKKSYEMLNSFIKEFYKRIGLQAEFAKDVFSQKIGRRENFCFSSCECFDFIIKGKKIGGNAQRRKRNLIFQHGSIPYELDFKKIENSIEGTKLLSSRTTCLKELFINTLNLSEISNTFRKSFESIFKINLEPECLSEEERNYCYFLMETKYTTKEWNLEKVHKASDLEEFAINA